MEEDRHLLRLLCRKLCRNTLQRRVENTRSHVVARCRRTVLFSLALRSPLSEPPATDPVTDRNISRRTYFEGLGHTIFFYILAYLLSHTIPARWTGRRLPSLFDL